MYEQIPSVRTPVVSMNPVPQLGWFPIDRSDTVARLQHFLLALSEHPAVAPYLNKHGLRIGTDEEGKLSLLPDHSPDRVAFTLDLWRDPAIRPLFDQYQLRVWGGRDGQPDREENQG